MIDAGNYLEERDEDTKGEPNVLRGENTTTFTPQIAGMPEVLMSFDKEDSRDLTIVDLNQDGRLDIVIVYAQEIRWYQQLANGSFHPNLVTSEIDDGRAAVAVDLN